MMNKLNTEIIALKNKKTGNYFIYLEDIIEDKIKLINPQGEIINISLNLFEDQFFNISMDKLNNYFTKEQIETYLKYNQKLEELNNLIKANSKPIQKIINPKYYKTQRHSDKPKDKIIISNPKKSWSSSKLIFYRHYIDALKDNQYFSIVVENIGTFKMSKKEFINNFSEVIISEKYKVNGFYIYEQIPQKAYKFLEPKSHS